MDDIILLIHKTSIQFKAFAKLIKSVIFKPFRAIKSKIKIFKFSVVLLVSRYFSGMYLFALPTKEFKSCFTSDRKIFNNNNVQSNLSYTPLLPPREVLTLYSKSRPRSQTICPPIVRHCFKKSRILSSLTPPFL